MQNNNNKNMKQCTKRVWKQHLYEIVEYLQEKCISKKAMTLGAAVLMLVGLLGVRYRISGSLIPASSTVGGKALPIYCVQTEEPKIALTFDAAWGNEDTQKIMEILKKHNIKVTFFMTGGWVDRWAYHKQHFCLFYHILQTGNLHFLRNQDIHPTVFQKPLSVQYANT